MKYFLSLLFHIAFSPHLCQLISCSEYKVEAGDLPYIEWCEDGGERRRVTVDKCQSFPFVYPYPNCYCLSGIAVLKIESDGQTSYDVQFGKRGCFSHKSYGSGSGQRLVELQAFKFNEDETIVGLLGREENSKDLKWSFKRIPQPEPISSSGSIVIYNGQLIELNEEYQGGLLYCVQRNKDPELSRLVQRYELEVGSNSDSDADIIWIILKDVCDGGNYLEDENLVSLTQLATPDSHSCTPICPEYEETFNWSRSKARSPSIHQLLSDQLSDAELLNMTKAEEKNKVKECKPIPLDLKASHWALNRKILRHSIESAFPDQQTVKKKFKPLGSFKILDLLGKITTKYCRNAKIPRDFLEQAISYFKIAHEGTTSYEFSEFFSTENLFTIQKMLRKCLWSLESPLYRHYKSKGCSNPEIFKTYKNDSSHEDAVTIKQSVEHQYFDYHLVLDVPWNMLDLVNTVCIKGFSGSYRMYHEMEQGIEALFTPQLRQFWLYPDVSSFSTNFYAHLFGPQWMTFARNLEKCVETAYLEMPGMSRLQRPIWLSEGRHSQGQHGTHVDHVCTRRRIDVPLVSENYEIYCENINVDEMNWPSKTRESSLVSSDGGNGSILENEVDGMRTYIDWLWPLDEQESSSSSSFSLSTGEEAEIIIENKGTTDQPEQNEILIHSLEEEGAELESEQITTQIVQADFEPQTGAKTEVVSNSPSTSADSILNTQVEDTVYLSWLNQNEKRSASMEDYLDWTRLDPPSEDVLKSPSKSPNDFTPSSEHQRRTSTFSLNPNGDDSQLLYDGESKDIDVEFDFDLLMEKEEDVELDRPKDWTKRKKNKMDSKQEHSSLQGQGLQHWRQLDKSNDGNILVDNEPNRRNSMEANDKDSDVKFEASREKAFESKSKYLGLDFNAKRLLAQNIDWYKIRQWPKQTTSKHASSLDKDALTVNIVDRPRETNEKLTHKKNVTKFKTTSELIKMNMYFPIR